MTHATIGVHLFFSEGPQLRSSIPDPGTDFKNQMEVQPDRLGKQRTRYETKTALER